MRARQLNKRIEIYQVKTVYDGFSGKTVYDELITSSWAKVETHDDKRQQQNEVGIDDYSQKLKITMRFRNDVAYNSVNQFLMYRGVKYTFTVSPNDMDFSSTFITLIAQREVLKEVSLIEPINPDANTIFVNYKNRVEANDGELSSETCTQEYIDSLL